MMIVPTLCVGMPPWTLRVHCDAERPGMHSHAERGNDQATFKTWTAMETILSVVGLGFILLLSLFV